MSMVDDDELLWQQEQLDRLRKEGERIAGLHAAHDFSALRRRLMSRFREVVVPGLRELGFRGSLPNLYRVRDGLVDVLFLQFDRYGGGFTVNLGRSPLRMRDDPSTVRLRSIPFEDRARLTRDTSGIEDRWFRYDEPEGTPEQQQDTAIQEVASLIESADRWLRTGRPETHIVSNS